MPVIFLLHPTREAVLVDYKDSMAKVLYRKEAVHQVFF